MTAHSASAAPNIEKPTVTMVQQRHNFRSSCKTLRTSGAVTSPTLLASDLVYCAAIRLAPSGSQTVRKGGSLDLDQWYGFRGAERACDVSYEASFILSSLDLRPPVRGWPHFCSACDVPDEFASPGKRRSAFTDAESNADFDRPLDQSWKDGWR
jgi:hypothetical protein